MGREKQGGGTMGETTRRRLADLVHSVKIGTAAAHPRQGYVGNALIGGYNGGLGGTWAKAATGRGPHGKSHDKPSTDVQNRARSQEGATRRFHEFNHSRPSTGRRPAIRRNSSGERAAWDVNQAKSHARGFQSHGYASRRPKSASHLASHTRALMTMSPDDCDVPITGKGVSCGSGASFSFATKSPDRQKKHANSLMKAASSATRESSPPWAERNPEGEEDIGMTRQSEGRIPTHSPTAEEEMVSDAHLARLEREIRDTVRERRSVYEGEKELLKRLFRDVDDGSGDVHFNELRSVISQLGVRMSVAEAKALFRKYGHKDAMPHSKFVNAVLRQPNKRMADELQVRKGAFVAGQSANFSGKIIYPQCRSAVYTPSEWDENLVERSAEVPGARLHLEFVYGYAGLTNTSQNLFYACDGRIVYYTAGIGVVYTPTHQRRQTFFLGHTDDIKSIALCQCAVRHSGSTYPPRSLVATGQVTSHSGGGYVCIWDSRPCGEAGLAEIAKIQFEKEDRGITALAFSPDGKKLVCVAMDNAHTVYVFDWRKGIRLSQGKGFNGDPPQVYGVEWDSFATSAERFVTYGKKHAKIWQNQATGEYRWQSTQLTFGRYPMQNVHSVAFLKPKSGWDTGLLAAGMASGEIYLFKGTQAFKSIVAHRPGPKLTSPDGSISYAGVRGMKLLGTEANVLVTGGSDGTVLRWDVSDGTVTESKMASRPIHLGGEAGFQDGAPDIRAIDSHPVTGELIVGTSGCDIWNVTEEHQEVIVHGHSGDLYGVCWHPTNPSVFSTACDCSWLAIYDADKRDMVCAANMGFSLRCVCFSTAPVHEEHHHIAAGGAKGRLKIVHEDGLRPIFTARDAVQGITDLKYSPNNNHLAVASVDGYVDVYNVANGYARTSRCVGHSSTVRHVDWSIDSTVIQSNCSAYEILYWNPKTGKQVKQTQRDVRWHSWTCILGFPVMGIWPDYSDGTDVNSCDRSSTGEFLVTSGDDGLVKLFHFPCVVEDAPYRAYRGHSSHVMCVRFNCNDSMVSSAGGKDRAVFQFRLAMIEPEPAPEAKPEPVWGPLDSSGKSFGWVQPSTVERNDGGINPSHPPQVPNNTGLCQPQDDCGTEISIDDRVVAEVQEEGSGNSDGAAGWG